MKELQLDEYTLGQKRQHYNKLVQDAIINNKTVDIEQFNLEDSDIINLTNIDIASHNRNLAYILKVLACDDMLYVSRAIKRSDWLINDQAYAHIINPKYFHSHLFPLMCSKAMVKFVTHVRNVLRDEERGEEFYTYEENPKEAMKWLPCCSLKFIEENIKNHVQYIKPTLLTRLCEKSINILEIYIKHEKDPHRKRIALQTNMFLLRSNLDKYLDLVETSVCPKFNKKATNLLLKTRSTRVIDKFEKYYDHINFPAFTRTLKQEHIKDFLISLAERYKKTVNYGMINPKHLFMFIEQMPQKIRFEFVKQVFIDKIHESKEYIAVSEREREGLSIISNITRGHMFSKSYIWYRFAPFNVAFEKIQESIQSVSYSHEKLSMLETLFISTQNKLPHELVFLEYLRNKHKNTENKVMERIVTKIILNNNFINYDTNTWAIIDDIFKGTDIYSESKNSANEIIEAVIIYNIINKKKVPEVVENKFNFNSLLRFHKKLDKKQKEIIFTYLYDYITVKHVEYQATDESTFNIKMNYLVLMLNLLKDYKKELGSFPAIILLIKLLIKTKNDLSLTLSMEKLFNIKKTWRKLLFEESLELSQRESALVNALKHGPSLLNQNRVIVQNMLCNNKMTLRLTLNKIKIFWPDTLAKDIILNYTEELNGPRNHKAITRGLSILLAHKQLQELIEKYTPNNVKVNWDEIDEIKLSVQQQLAKNMHNARPQPPPEYILPFAKGDYLQYALPSLLSIFHNLNSVSSQKYIPNLLDAPVSLQKHGIRIAVSKLELDQLLLNLSNIWKNNKNASIRSVMFKIIFKTLCKEKDSNKIKKVWEVIEMFVDNLTFKEDKAIYKLLFDVKEVHFEVRARLYMKSYIFLHKLIHSGDQFKDYNKKFYYNFTSYCREIIEELNPKFVEEIITEYITEEFTKTETYTNDWSRGCVISIISSFLLCADNDKIQLERYENALLPILKQSFTLWNTKHYIRNNMKSLLDSFRNNIKPYVIDKKKVIPSKLFLLMQEELQQTLEIPENYMLLTKWKLTTTFVNILNKHQPLTKWKQSCIKVASEFGNNCCDYLKEDCNKYFPRIYILFVKALNSFLENFIPEVAYWNIYKCFINDKSFIHGYLAAIKLSTKICQLRDDDERKEMKTILSEMCKNINEHPSAEIKMHYCFFKKRINANLKG